MQICVHAILSKLLYLLLFDYHRTTAHIKLLLDVVFLFDKKNKTSTFTKRHCPYIPPQPNSFIYYWKKMQNVAKFAFTRHCPYFCTSCFFTTTDIKSAKFAFTRHCPYFCTFCFFTRTDIKMPNLRSRDIVHTFVPKVHICEHHSRDSVHSFVHT